MGKSHTKSPNQLHSKLRPLCSESIYIEGWLSSENWGILELSKGFPILRNTGTLEITEEHT